MPTCLPQRLALTGRLSVARQHHRETLHLRDAHDRRIVLFRRFTQPDAAPAATRLPGGDRRPLHIADGESVTRPRDSHLCFACCVAHLLCLEGGLLHRARQHQGRLKASCDGGKRAHVVGMKMREHHHRNMLHAQAIQTFQHRCWLWANVNQYSGGGARTQDGGVALSHITKRNQPVARPAWQRWLPHHA